ncbi:hypothetical protein DTW92_15720 [Paracoccus pantotrophus]|nr:hypothetical protein DTW92_15720 [Paracoccus pantotrophus]
MLVKPAYRPPECFCNQPAPISGIRRGDRFHKVCALFPPLFVREFHFMFLHEKGGDLPRLNQ